MTLDADLRATLVEILQDATRLLGLLDGRLPPDIRGRRLRALLVRARDDLAGAVLAVRAARERQGSAGGPRR